MIRLSKKILADLKKMPIHIAVKFQALIDAGISGNFPKIKNLKSYDIEPLGNKKYSIKLNQTYKVICLVEKNQDIYFIEIIKNSSYPP
jgi:hypothetical protein